MVWTNNVIIKRIFASKQALYTNVQKLCGKKLAFMIFSELQNMQSNPIWQSWKITNYWQWFWKSKIKIELPNYHCKNRSLAQFDKVKFPMSLIIIDVNLISGNLLCVWTFNKKDVELKPSFANLLKCLSIFDTVFLVSFTSSNRVSKYVFSLFIFHQST